MSYKDKETIKITLRENSPLSSTHVGVGCLICDEFVRLTDREVCLMSHGRSVVRVCDKCKDAIKRMRDKNI